VHSWDPVVPKDQKPVNQQPKSFYAHASPSVKGEESHIPKSVKTFPSLTVKPSILDSRFDRCRKHAAKSAKPSAMKDGARHLARACGAMAAPFCAADSFLIV